MATIVIEIENTDPDEDVAKWFNKTFKLDSLQNIRIVGFKDEKDGSVASLRYTGKLTPKNNRDGI